MRQEEVKKEFLDVLRRILEFHVDPTHREISVALLSEPAPRRDLTASESDDEASVDPLSREKPRPARQQTTSTPFSFAFQRRTVFRECGKSSDRTSVPQATGVGL